MLSLQSFASRVLGVRARESEALGYLFNGCLQQETLRLQLMIHGLPEDGFRGWYRHQPVLTRLVE